MRSSTVTRHAAPWGQCTGPHLSVGSVWYSIRNKHTVCNEPRLREEVYPVCSEPLIPPDRGGLPSVQWALQPSWERRFKQCAVGPSSILREEVYPVCSEPLIPPERGDLPSVQWALPPSWERRFTQCAVGPSSLLREEVYTYCAVGPSSLLRDEVYPVCSGPSSLTLPERWGLPSVQWAAHP